MNILYNKILTCKFIPKLIGILMVIGVYWLFQGSFYLKKTEAIIKLIHEVFLFIIMWLLLSFITDSTIILITISLLISHTINWLINCNLFSLFKTFGIVHTSDDNKENFIRKLTIDSINNSSIMWVGIFGSYSEENDTTDSDLDIRLIRSKGMVNSLRAFSFLQRQRIWANMHKFPLDIYLLDSMDELKYMSENAIEIKSFTK